MITNSKGVITGFDDVTATTFNLSAPVAPAATVTPERSAVALAGTVGTIEANGTVIGFGDNGDINGAPEYAAYDAASKVYYVDKDYKDINEIGVSGVTDDANDYVRAARDNTVPASWKKLKNMVIVEVPGNDTPTPPTPVSYVFPPLPLDNLNTGEKTLLPPLFYPLYD